jgi:MFS family permease
LLTAAAASLTAVDQLTRTLLFPIADYRFELEGSYRQLKDPYEIVSSVFLLVGGLMAMRMRLRSALLIFAIVHLIAVIIVLLAPNTWWLFVASVILGAGRGGSRALGVSAVGDYFGRNRFATLLGTQGLLIAVAELAMVGGPLLVTKLAENPTWEYAAAIVPAAVGIGAYRMLGDPKHAPSEATLGDAQD